MATPKRGDIAVINAMKRREHGKQERAHQGYTEKDEYLQLEWDAKHGQLHLAKRSRYEELKGKYGNQ